MQSSILKTEMAKSVSKKCRTCLKTEKNLQSLEEQMGLKFIQVTYKKALVSLTNITIQVDQEEYMPQGICNTCSRKLKAAQQFIKQAQDANFELTSLLRDVQHSSMKPLDCLKEPPIDLDVTNYVQVKLEEEISESQPIASAIKINSTVHTENILTIKKENVCTSKFEDFDECQGITKEDSVYPLDSVSIDPLPDYCSAEKCDDVSQSSTIAAPSESSNSKKHGKRKSVKTKLKDDDLLPIGCEDCGKIYENAKHLARHRKSAHLPEELKIPCPNCGRKFSRKCNLYTHMRTFHGKESVEELLRPPDSLIARKKYQCEKCPCKYTNVNKLRAHVRHKHDAAQEEALPPKKTENNKVKRTYTFLCTICGMSCSSQTVLRRHTLLHTGEKPFKCNACNKAYARSYDLVVHRRIHTGERPLKCNICAKAFSRSDVLADHIRSHSNERPYKCTQCERCFKRPKELTIHMRIHTGERPYTCGVCFNTFTQRISLKAHRVKHGHVETPNPDVRSTDGNNITPTPTSMPV